MSGRGAIFAIADDVMILAPSVAIRELAESFAILAWEAAGLTTQIVKNRIFVQHSARATWGHYLNSSPRNSLTELPVHDIPDEVEMVDPFDLDRERIWPDEDGVNIMGIPFGSNLFVSSYLQGKGLKNCLLLHFIQDVAAASFLRETDHMLKVAAIPRLSHILRSVQKNKCSI